MNYIISLDIGGTNLRAAIVDSDFNIVKSIIRSTGRGNKESFYEDVITIISDLDYFSFYPVAISMGVPGRVRPNGFIDALPNIGITDIDLVSVLTKRFNLPVFVKNDAEIAAVGEGFVGSGKGLKSTYFVTISTGIGGALFEDGKIKNPSKEIGHMLVNYKGGYYELEKIASGMGILKLLEINNLPLESAKVFFDKVKENDLLYLGVYNDWLHMMATFLNFVGRAYNPDVIVVTGGVMKSSDVFFETLKEMVAPLKLVPTYFAQDSGLIGAAAYGFIQTSSL